jgi:hypothetical protein
VPPATLITSSARGPRLAQEPEHDADEVAFEAAQRFTAGLAFDLGAARALAPQRP